MAGINAQSVQWVTAFDSLLHRVLAVIENLNDGNSICKNKTLDLTLLFSVDGKFVGKDTPMLMVLDRFDSTSLPLWVFNFHTLVLLPSVPESTQKTPTVKSSESSCGTTTKKQNKKKRNLTHEKGAKTRPNANYNIEGNQNTFMLQVQPQTCIYTTTYNQKAML